MQDIDGCSSKFRFRFYGLGLRFKVFAFSVDSSGFRVRTMPSLLFKKGEITLNPKPKDSYFGSFGPKDRT